ncbi:MAG: PEP-CTERM sorting domain-containing protein [Algisphaera sp.]
MDLEGTFKITLLNGFMPAFGDTFDVFNAGQISGSFSQLDLATLSSGLSFDTSQLETAGVLTVVPEPATAAVLGMLGAAGLLRRRRA